MNKTTFNNHPYFIVSKFSDLMEVDNDQSHFVVFKETPNTFPGMPGKICCKAKKSLQPMKAELKRVYQEAKGIKPSEGKGPYECWLGVAMKGEGGSLKIFFFDSHTQYPAPTTQTTIRLEDATNGVGIDHVIVDPKVEQDLNTD